MEGKARPSGLKSAGKKAGRRSASEPTSSPLLCGGRWRWRHHRSSISTRKRRKKKKEGRVLERGRCWGSLDPAARRSVKEIVQRGTRPFTADGTSAFGYKCTFAGHDVAGEGVRRPSPESAVGDRGDGSGIGPRILGQRRHRIDPGLADQTFSNPTRYAPYQTSSIHGCWAGRFNFLHHQNWAEWSKLCLLTKLGRSVPFSLTEKLGRAEPQHHLSETEIRPRLLRPLRRRCRRTKFVIKNLFYID